MNKVLVIEDTRAFGAMIVAHIERELELDCVLCASLQQTKEVLAASKDEFFIAIIDIHLPDAPHGEAVDAVLSEGIAGIVFTGQLSEALREDMLSKGITDYVLKQGQANIEYVTSMVDRIHHNLQTKVLIVDDSRTARRQLTRLLYAQRFQILQAESGEQALELMQEHDDIRIMVVDCYMDGMDGFELCQAVRTKHSKEDIVIIGVSSQGSQALSARFMKSGANDFLLKPFLPEEFFCRVNHAAASVQMFHDLREANEKKNQLLGMAAHDIRGPLGIIYKTSEILLKRQLKDKDKAEFLRMINQNSSDMLELLSHLLDISAIESGKLELRTDRCDINNLIQDRIKLYQLDAESKSIVLKSNLEARPEISVDSSRIKQVIDNLLTNAIKYSPHETIVQITLSQTDDFMQLNVTDQGPGIPENEVPRLFNPFSKLSTKTTGGESSTGLGLAICKSIVEAHCGELGFQPALPHGSDFFFKLPLQSGHMH